MQMQIIKTGKSSVHRDHSMRGPLCETANGMIAIAGR